MAETVIIGAGIVGVSTAYYLSQHQTPESIHLVETTESLFASASGYAGGFLARNWFGPDVAPLAALSFDQHRALATQFDGPARWGYATSTSLSYQMPSCSRSGKGDADGGEVDGVDEPKPRGDDWLFQGTSRSDVAAAGRNADGASAKQLPTWMTSKPGETIEVLDSVGTSAQLDPLQFCQYLMQACRDRGVQLHQPARVVAVNGAGETGELASVCLETGGAGSAGGEAARTSLSCTRLIIAAGAWSARVIDELFGHDANHELPIANLAGHSVVVRRPPPTGQATAAAPEPCHAVFSAGDDLVCSPELLSRINGEIYLAGLNAPDMPLPAKASDCVPQPDQIDKLLATCKQVMGGGTEPSSASSVEIVRTGLCHRPITPWGLPMVLRMSDGQLQRGGSSSSVKTTKPGAAGGVFLAAGHGPWGISMGPGTGLVLAELAQGRPLSADVSKLGWR